MIKKPNDNQPLSNKGPEKKQKHSTQSIVMSQNPRSVNLHFSEKIQMVQTPQPLNDESSISINMMDLSSSHSSSSSSSGSSPNSSNAKPSQKTISNSEPPKVDIQISNIISQHNQITTDLKMSSLEESPIVKNTKFQKHEEASAINYSSFYKFDSLKEKSQCVSNPVSPITKQQFTFNEIKQRRKKTLIQE